MTQFEKLRGRVDAAVAALPYALNEEQNERLQNELRAIRDYRRAEMLNAVTEVVTEYKDTLAYPMLDSRYGYCVSYVCWLLGISDFNPIDHPWLISERYALNTFKEEKVIVMYYDMETSWKSVMTRLYGSKAEFRYISCEVNTDGTEDGQCFTIRILPRIKSHLYQVERMIRDNVDPAFRSADIPLDDEGTFSLLHSHDWFGINGSSGINEMFIEAMRVIHPSTFSEFVHTWAMRHGTLIDIDMYVYNRDNGITEYSGVPSVDEILRQSNGVLLYTGQEEAIEEITQRLSPEDVWNVKLLTDNRSTESKCSVYTEAVNIFRRAYMKAHYPEIFRQVMIATEV